MTSADLLERYGARLAVEGNVTDSPLLPRLERNQMLEALAGALIERAERNPTVY